MGILKNKIDFEVIARDEKGEIGKGVHTRFIEDSQRIMETAQELHMREMVKYQMSA